MNGKNNKPVVLWCWWYDRMDLINPLLPIMSNCKNFFLFYRFKEQENLFYDLPGKRCYWTQFSSPYQIIDYVKPDKIVFFGIENLLTIALVSASRRKKIPTYLLMHGLLSSYESAMKDESNTDLDLVERRYSQKNPFYHKRKLHSLIFYLQAVGKAPLKEKVFLLKLLKNSMKPLGTHKRMFENKSVYRQADYYIVFTKYLARLFFERDAVNDDKLIEVGVYSLDSLFRDLLNESPKVANDGIPYLLVIDQPLGTVTAIQKNSFWENLVKAADENGLRLMVKLHPSDFNNPDPFVDNRITWIRENQNLSELIGRAEACIGYFSTLLLPVIPNKLTIIFDPTNDPIVEKWKGLKVVNSLPFFEKFSGKDLAEAMKLNKEADFQEYERLFVYKRDGKSSERVLHVLSFVQNKN